MNPIYFVLWVDATFLWFDHPRGLCWAQDVACWLFVDFGIVGLDSSILSDDERSVIFFFPACVGLSGDASDPLRMGQGCPVHRGMRA